MSDATDPLVSAVADFQEAAFALRRAAQKVADDPPDLLLEHWLLTLLDVRDGQDAASAARAALGRVAYGLMPANEVRVAGFSRPFRKVHGWSRKWDMEQVLDALLPVARTRRHRGADPSTGEVEPADSALLAVVKRVVGGGYARITAMRELGMDPDEYVVEKTRIEPNVSLPREGFDGG